MKRFFSRMAAAATLAVLAMASVPAAQASELEIQFLGLDMHYDGIDLYDAQSPFGGNGSPANADALTTITFLVDGAVVGTLNSNIWSDFFIADVHNLPAAGGAVLSGGNADDFGFDLLTTPAGFGLALNIDLVNVFYAGSQIFVSGGGVASSVPVQALPFGLQVDTSKPITFAFSSANMSSLATSGGFVTAFDASGTGNIRATLVPEPSTALLVALGMLSTMAGCRRRA